MKISLKYVAKYSSFRLKSRKYELQENVQKTWKKSRYFKQFIVDYFLCDIHFLLLKVEVFIKQPK